MYLESYKSNAPNVNSITSQFYFYLKLKIALYVYFQDIEISNWSDFSVSFSLLIERYTSAQK